MSSEALPSNQPITSLTEEDNDASALVRIHAARLRRLHEQASQKQIKCLDTLWRGVGALYHFQCPQGHGWKRNALNLGALSCPVCNPLPPPPPQTLLPPPPAVRPPKLVLSRADARQKERLERLQHIAVKHGGQCLGEEHAGAAKQYRFRCAQGHEWVTQADYVMQEHWCPHCAHLQRKAQRQLAYEKEWGRLQQIVQVKGGQCLSEEYSGPTAYYRFRCASGHEWETRAVSILSGRWCSHCAGARQRLSLEDAQAAAHEHGGQCLSETYINASTKMTWVCQHGHVWEATLSQIRQNSWCHKCRRLDRLAGKLPPRPRIREITAGTAFESDL